MAKHNWQKFALHPSDPIVPLVRECYSNILTSDQKFAMVRCVKVSFAAGTINLHLGLDDLDDDFTALLESISTEELTRVLVALTIEGTNWLPDKGDGIFLCSRSALLHIPKI